MAKVEIFYNPNILGYHFFKGVYRAFELTAPTPEEMKEDIIQSEKSKTGFASFNALPRDLSKKIANFFLDHPVGIKYVKVSELEKL